MPSPILSSKSKLLLFCALSWTMLSNAQSYYPMLADSNTWYVTYEFEGCYTYIYKTLGDTVLNGLAYRIVVDANLPPPCGVPCVVGYLREDTILHKVFAKNINSFLVSSDTPEYVYYDFNLSTGDSIYIVEPGIICANQGHYPDTVGWVHVDSVSMVQTLVGNRKAIYLGYPQDTGQGCPNYMVWVEGIGATFGRNLRCDILSYNILSCSYQDTTHQFFQPAYTGDTSCICDLPGGIIETPAWKNNLSVYPNPSDDFSVLSIKGEPTIFSASIYDITGRKMEPLFDNMQISSFQFSTQNLPLGIYLVKVTDYQGESVMLKLIKE